MMKTQNKDFAIGPAREKGNRALTRSLMKLADSKVKPPTPKPETKPNGITPFRSTLASLGESIQVAVAVLPKR